MPAVNDCPVLTGKRNRAGTVTNHNRDSYKSSELDRQTHQALQLPPSSARTIDIGAGTDYSLLPLECDVITGYKMALPMTDKNGTTFSYVGIYAYIVSCVFQIISLGLLLQTSLSPSPPSAYNAVQR